MRKILIVDDEEKLRNLLAKIVVLEGFEVLQAGDAKTALKKIEQSEIDVVLCDVKLPDIHGVALIQKIKEVAPFSEVILLTAYGNIADGVQAIKNGAFDYITKGDDNNKIIPLLHKALEKVTLARRIQQLQQQVEKKYSFDQISGNSKAIVTALNLAKKVSQTDTTVLLLGETGTGKEVFAQAIHYDSYRGDKPFVALNCSAFSRELLESELFGHKSGAFTGALKEKKGLFEEAHTGTIFLDEIGEMAIDLQAKLLRVLEAGEFIKIGDTKPTKVNVRIIAATNRNLEEEINQGHFRRDLYYRLSVFQITLPPLRERASDIALLAKNFAQLFGLKMNKKIKSLTPDCIKALEQYEWSGNIRELKNVIERSVILADSEIVTPDCLPYEIQHASPGSSGTIFSMAHMEQAHIQKVLKHTQGNKAEAARLLEIGIATLYRKIDEYKIR